MPNLSASAVAVLRFEIKGWRARDPGRRLPAYRELAAAGIMEPGSGAEYRFTEYGLAHREAILEREWDRIERGRLDPPDTGGLSDAAWGLLRRIASGERVPIEESNKLALRELAAARIIYLVSGFATGPESHYKFTYWGWKRKDEWLAHPAGSP